MEDLARSVIGLIDLTDLADDHGGDRIDDLCARARAHRTAAVCVWPDRVVRCVDRLAGSSARVATVVNFPSGDDDVAAVAALTEQVLGDGADEVDLVLPYRALLAGDDTGPAGMVAAIGEIVHRWQGDRHLKVILETGALVEPEVIRHAALLAAASGADFLKTSTGKTAVGATIDAARILLEVIRAEAASGRSLGIKPSGGIRTLADASGYLELADEIMGSGWVSPATFRFGASVLLDAAITAM